MTNIKVLNVRPAKSSGPLRAFADVRIGHVEVRDCRIVQQEGQEPWVSMPQREYDKDGERRWFAIVRLFEPLKERVEAAVVQEWKQTAQEISTAAPAKAAGTSEEQADDPF